MWQKRLKGDGSRVTGGGESSVHHRAGAADEAGIGQAGKTVVGAAAAGSHDLEHWAVMAVAECG